MSRSFILKPITLFNFTPPHGTTKVVELTLAERKIIGRQNLANHVARLFARDPISITIKSYDQYFTIANIAWGFQVTRCRLPWGSSVGDSHAFNVFSGFAAYLGSGIFTPTDLLRMAKLIRQNTNDKLSIEGSKTKKSDL